MTAAVCHDDPSTGMVSHDWIAQEYAACAASPAYFIHHYCHIYDKRAKDWVLFHLWPAQRRATEDMQAHLLMVILKARQLGLTWLVLCVFLWRMLFQPISQIMLFSLRDDEAVHLLDDRLKGIYSRLPRWLQCRAVLTDDKHIWKLSNGSEARAFSTKSGDSYAATDVLVDEADLIPDLGALLARNKATIDGGGHLVLLSRVDKSQPGSAFKAIYRAAKRGANNYFPLFLPWSARPDRDQAWHDAECADALANFGCLDSVHEQYPGTDTEALMGGTLGKRLPPAWLEAVYSPLPVLEPPAECAHLDGLRIYHRPIKGRVYVCGGDPAEGVPGGDDSALCIQDKVTGVTVAHLAGLYEPKEDFPEAIARLSRYYNAAACLPERNNHGHALISGLVRRVVMVLSGHDGREGWATTAPTKAQMYDDAADTLKTAAKAGQTLLHDFATQQQLAAIDRKTLCHPDKRRGQTGVDDEATAWVLSNKARSMSYDDTGEGWL